MDDAVVLDTLRSLLKMEPARLDGRITEVVETLPADPTQLARVRLAIAKKLPAAGERYREPMANIVAALEGRIRAMSSDPQVLAGLAEEVWSLERQRQLIERRLDEIKATVAVAMGPDQQRIAGRFGIKTAGLVHSLKVSSPSLVPAEFSSRQPDRKAILMHFHQTGEVVEGTTITTRRPAVKVWEVES